MTRFKFLFCFCMFVKVAVSIHCVQNVRNRTKLKSRMYINQRNIYFLHQVQFSDMHSRFRSFVVRRKMRRTRTWLCLSLTHILCQNKKSHWNTSSTKQWNKNVLIKELVCTVLNVLASHATKTSVSCALTLNSHPWVQFRNFVMRKKCAEPT